MRFAWSVNPRENLVHSLTPGLFAFETCAGRTDCKYSLFKKKTVAETIIRVQDQRGLIMPYYSEAETRELRLRIEDIVLSWPGVMKKMMFGAPSYGVGKTLFAILMTGGIILTQLSEEEKMRLLKDPRAGYFEGHGRVIKKWVIITLPNPLELEHYLPYLQSGYEAALKSS